MGLAIPNQILVLLTFPGVVAHEVVEQLFCRWLGVAVLDVCYFRFGNPTSYVFHEPSLNVRDSLAVGLGPFFVNSLLGALIAFPAVLPALEFRVSTVQSYTPGVVGYIDCHARDSKFRRRHIPLACRLERQEFHPDSPSGHSHRRVLVDWCCRTPDRARPDLRRRGGRRGPGPAAPFFPLTLPAR
jgi:hypothetical protein